MNSKRFGASNVDVPVIGQGTWDIPERGARAQDAKRAILRGIELGMTHIDTAEMYGAGGVEEFLGDALDGIPRERLFLASKVLPGNASYDGTIAACERSLKRMRIEYLDCYMLHWPSAEPLEETMRALAQLVRDGKTRFAGVSNFDVEDMLEARALLDPVPLVCNQVLYHLRERGIEHGLIARAREAGVAVTAYTPFGRGRFPAASTPGGAVLDGIARKHGATPRQVILAFLTRESNVFSIPKASRIEHVEENAGAANVVLDADDVAAIDAAFPVGDERSLATL